MFRGLWLVVAVLLPAASAAAETVRVEITRADCARLVEHQPAPDVEYEPGVDVRGEPVPPADLGSGVELALPETIRVLIEVELDERLGLPTDGESYQGTVPVGVVEVLDDGTVTFNGRPLQTEEQARLSRRCQEILRGDR